VPPPKTVAMTAAAACQVLQSGQIDWSVVASELDACAVPVYDPAHAAPSGACAAACGGNSYSCRLPDDYLKAYVAAQPLGTLAPEVYGTTCADGGDVVEAGIAMESDAGATGAAVCPPVSGNLSVVCYVVPCTGRWTSGVDTLGTVNPLSTGEYFAKCSYYEAASVYAFERLARELGAHGAPASLVQAALLAAKDEVRHARTMRALARGFGVEPRWPDAPDLSVRPLVEVARENATEGCIRETYGAVMGLVAAARASDPNVRAAMQSIARDECSHAELSWQVSAWAASQLGPRDWEQVRRALRVAAQGLLAGDDDEPASEQWTLIAGIPSGSEARRIARLLDDALFRAA
jgi:hypothetical protein